MFRAIRDWWIKLCMKDLERELDGRTAIGEGNVFGAIQNGDVGKQFRYQVLKAKLENRDYIPILGAHCRWK